MDVVISPELPVFPSLADDAIRSVRHGLADILEWLGEEVGPKPGEATCHVLYVGSRIFVSQEAYDGLIQQAHSTN